MQFIWSRTAQTRSCRCHSCLHAATTLARRTTTVASKRRLKASDVFTACYSAMFATAALVDMKFKDDRRKQWDIVIAEAKSSRNGIQPIDSSSPSEDTAGIIESGHSGPQNIVHHKAVSILSVHERNSMKTPTISEWDQHRLTSSSKCQGTTLEAELKALGSHIQGVLVDRELDTTEEGSVPAEVEETNLGSAPRYSGKPLGRVPKRLAHCVHAQEMILKLVTRFLIGDESSDSAVLTVHPADYDSRQAKFLKTGTIWRPTYSASNVLLGVKMDEEYKFLNESIRTILTKEESIPTNLNSVVAKICYNLLISATPPNIDTYNIMLVHFTRLRQHHFAQAVVDSFFQDSRFRPNSCTITAMLDHYAATNNREGFEEVVQRMRGTHGNMRIKTRLLSGLDDPVVQSWAQQRKVIHRNDLLIEKVPRNTAIFNSLILGSLRIVGSRRAVMYLKAALREGCHISGDLFVRVAQACLTEKNKKAAIALLSVIITRWHKLQGAWQEGAYPDSLEAILRLMKLCGLELSTNGHIYLPGELRKVDFQVLKAWVRSFNLEILDEYLRRSARSISGLEILFAASLSKKFTTEQVVLWMLELIDLHPVTEPRREPGAFVTAIQLVTYGFSGGCKGLAEQLFDVNYGGLSAKSRENYDTIYKQSPHLDMTSKLAVLQNLGSRRQENEEQNRISSVRHDRAQLPSEAEEQEWEWPPSMAAAWT